MQTLSKRDRNLLVIMVIVIIFAGVLVLFPSGKPGSGKLLPLDQANKEDIKTRISIQTMTTNVARLQPMNEQMTYDIPPEQLGATISENLYELADKAGVHIREIKPLRARTLSDGTLTTVPLEVRFRAPFQPNVMRFLYYAEDPSSKMVVDKISITSPDTKVKAVDVSAQITVFTRSVPEPKGKSTNPSGQSGQSGQAGQVGQGETSDTTYSNS